MVSRGLLQVQTRLRKAIVENYWPGIIGLRGRVCCKIALKRTAVDAAGTTTKNLSEEFVSK